MTNSILNGEMSDVGSLETNSSKDVSHHYFSLILFRPIVKQPEKIKERRIRMEEVKPPLFADCMIIFSENLKEFINKLLALIRFLATLTDKKSTHKI